MNKIKYEYHCIYCNYHWEEDITLEYANTPCVLPCPKCKDYGVNRVRPYVKSIKLNSQNK